MKNKTKQFLRNIRSFRVNRKYKDRLFRYIFKEKEDLLALYNAVNHTAYTDPQELTITTLKDVIYLRMKNDIGFLIACRMNLYEHQSTWNPNMPLRGLLYFADMLRAYVETMGLNLYSSKRIELPFPQYIIFYNGEASQPDRLDLLLSDSFPENPGEQPALECRATMLNINYGHNQEIMQNCRRLSDYAYFIQAVRQRLEQHLSLTESLEYAADECIEKGILADILIENRAEVMSLLLTTFNEKLYSQSLREEGREEGREQGREEAMNQINALYQRLLDENREADLKKAISDPHYRSQLLKEYGFYQDESF